MMDSYEAFREWDENIRTFQSTEFDAFLAGVDYQHKQDAALRAAAERGVTSAGDEDRERCVIQPHDR